MLTQGLDQRLFDGPHDRHAFAAGVKPGGAEGGVEGSARSGGAQGAAQALQLRHIGGELVLLPTGADFRLGKFFEGAQAAVLRINELHHALLGSVLALA